MALPIVCPAATLVEPPNDAPSILCGVLELSNDDAQLNGYRDRGQVNAMFSGSRDAGTVQNYCAGRGIPGSPMSYCACVIWRAEKARIEAARAAGQDGLRDPSAARPPTIDPELAEHVKLTAGASMGA
jgi:hypothetical protein